MIVFFAAGIAAQVWLKWPHGVAVGLLGGLIIASVLPSKAGGCGVTYQDEPAGTPPDADDAPGAE